MKKPLEYCFTWIIISLSTLGFSTINAREEDGKIDRIVGDLVYVKGLKAPIDSRLVSRGKDPIVNLQVIKVLKDVIVARVLKMDDRPCNSTTASTNTPAKQRSRDAGRLARSALIRDPPSTAAWTMRPGRTHPP